MRIRKANKGNLKEIGKLMKKEFAKLPFNERASLNAVLKSLNFYCKLGRIYVAVEQKIVGVVVFKKEQYWEGSVIIIEDLAVDEKFKKQGIGKNLVDYVESLAKKEKIKSICFKTHKKSKAVKFYQKYGYKLDKNAVFMRKEIEKIK